MVGYKHRLEEWKDDGPSINHNLEVMTRGWSRWKQSRVAKDGLVSLQNQSIRREDGSSGNKPEFKGRRKHRTEGCEQEVIRYNHRLEGMVNWKIEVKYRTWDDLDAEFKGGEEGMLRMQTQCGQGEEVMIQCKHRAD